MTIAFRVHAGDTVATLLADAAAGSAVEVRGEGSAADLLVAREAVAMGHKLATCAMAAGSPVMKFGIAIGTARAAIAPGEWVHLHNCASSYDERSGGFDVVTGAAKDIRYD